MNEQQAYIFIAMAIAAAMGAGTAAFLIWFGYWMGRNSADKPLRSPYNPAKTPDDQDPIDDQESDLFNDAAFGRPGEREPGISTIRGGGR